MLRPSCHRFAIFAAATVGGLLCALLSASPASADVPAAPSVSIVSPDAGPVAGTVTFSVSIDQPDQAHPVSDVYLQIFGQDRGWRARDISVADGECSPTCTISADFDTRSLVVPTNPDPVQSLPDLADGSAEFSAEVYTSFGPTASASTTLQIDNHRPVLTLPDLPVAADGSMAAWTGAGAIATRVQTSTDPSTGTPITGFRLMVPNFPITPLADVSITAPADGSGTGTITVDTSKAAPGRYIGYLVAVGSDGVTSALTEVLIVVPDPYHVAAHILTATPDAITISVTPTWLDHSTAAQTWLSTVSVYLDGILLGSGGNFERPHDAATLVVHGVDGAPFPAGDNTLTVTAVDNRGIERSVTQIATTTYPLTAAWASNTIIDGSPSGITVHVSDASQSQLAQIVLAVDGTRTSSVTYTQPSLTASVPATVKLAPGQHDVTATILLTNGQQYVLHHAVAAYGHAALALSTPASTTWGSTSTFHAELTMGGKAQTQALVYLQSRAPATTTWVTRASARTNTRGAATFAVAASSTDTASWRVITPVAGYRLAATSNTRNVSVTARFGHVPATATVHHSRTKRYTLTVTPYVHGVVTTIQCLRPGSANWTTQAHVTVPSTGHITIKTAFAHIGTYKLRVQWPTTPHIAATTSPVWSQHVVK